MAEPTCHYCKRPAEEECPTCGRLYCLEHGDDVCLRCLAPESATPSAKVYRGSVLALVVASLLAVFLVVRPPESKSQQDAVRPLPTSTPAVAATATPTRPGSAATKAPTTAATAAPTSPTPASPTAAPSGERSYTVAQGDTLSGIAAQFNTTVAAILALNPGVTAESLQIGATLKIPAAQ
ncbi:MAG: LysM peptidoglycan-binding domain-containing protein [Chloroflexi bacterium]|nr:LysM peptidoglycan-binding domain-containing protein [Chloroflexota bacterium]